MMNLIKKKRLKQISDFGENELKILLVLIEHGQGEANLIFSGRGPDFSSGGIVALVTNKIRIMMFYTYF